MGDAMKKLGCFKSFKTVASVAIGSFAGVLFAACGSPGQIGPGGGTGSGGGAAGAPSVKMDASLNGNGGSSGSGGGVIAPTGDANCGSVSNSTTRLPADVLLVLDRSGSMDYGLTIDSNCRTGDTTCSARWPTLTASIDTTLAATPGINWGLKLFSTPGGAACAVNNGVEVPIASNSAAAIQAQIGNVSPANNTPTAAAVTAATAYLKTVTDQNGKYILLATDGEPNCAGGSGTKTDLPATIAAITAAKAAGFPVYVIGIGPSVGNLDNMAQAGGTTKYYPATSAQDLTNALASISKAVATCSFTSSTPPPDPNNVAVYLDKSLVPKSATDGWTYGATEQTIVLTGTYCAKITAGTSSNVQILFGCKGSIDFPPIIP
jgi:hypothetical protein